MKVSGTTCTSPADATAKGVAGSTPGLPSASPAQSSLSSLPPEQGYSPDPEISAAHLSPGWSPGGQGLPTGWSEWDVLKWKGGLGVEYAPTSKADEEKRDLHCGKGTSAVQQAVPQTMLLSTSLQKASLLSTHCSPLLQIPLQHLITVPCWSIAGWSCCCWGKGCCMSLLSLQREVNGCGKCKGRDRRRLNGQEAHERP